MQDLEGKVALVPGGPNGIGLDMVKAFLNRRMKAANGIIKGESFIFCDGGWTRKLIEERTRDIFNALDRQFPQ